MDHDVFRAIFSPELEAMTLWTKSILWDVWWSTVELHSWQPQIALSFLVLVLQVWTSPHTCILKVITGEHTYAQFLIPTHIYEHRMHLKTRVVVCYFRHQHHYTDDNTDNWVFVITEKKTIKYNFYLLLSIVIDLFHSLLSKIDIGLNATAGVSQLATVLKSIFHEKSQFSLQWLFTIIPLYLK